MNIAQNRRFYARRWPRAERKNRNMYVKSRLHKTGSDTCSAAPGDTVLVSPHPFNEKKIGFSVVLGQGGNVLESNSERNICKAMFSADGAARQSLARDVMANDIKRCSPDGTLFKDMAIMTQERNRHMLVFDDDLNGVISTGDVITYRLDEVMREGKELRKYIEGTGYSY